MIGRYASLAMAATIDGMASGLSIGFSALGVLGEVHPLETVAWVVFSAIASLLSHRIYAISVRQSQEASA